MPRKPKTKPIKSLNVLFDVEDDDSLQKDRVIEELQEQLSEKSDALLQERFVWFVVLNVMFDAFAFQSMETWTGPLMIGLIQIIVIVALGRVWQMDPIWTLTEKIVDKWDGKFKG